MLCSRLTFVLLLHLGVSLFYCFILVRPDFVKLPATWKNVRDGDNVYHFTGNHTVMLALYEARYEQVLFGCGIYCTEIDCENGSYTFSVFIASNPTIGMLYINRIVEPRVVWSGNQDHPVGINATLELTGKGDLVLKDADGTVAWSTGTSGKSVVAMNLTDGGNLVLLDGNNETVWKSFDYPTDTLLLGQALKVGQKLTHSASWTNQTKDGLFTFSLASDGLSAAIESDSIPPLAYYSMNFTGRDLSYVRLANGSLDFVVDDSISQPVMNLPYASATQYVNLGSDGHLRLYDYRVLNGVVELADLMGLDPCRYPTACGNYGVCSQGNCMCPTSSGRNDYFEQRDPENPNRGCSGRAPLTCKESENRTFLEILNIDYFNFVAHLEDVDLESCKDACTKNCSCRAVFYRVSSDNSKKWCFLPSEVLSIINGTSSTGFTNTHTSAYIKVQRDLSESPRSAFPADDRGSNVRIVLASILAATIIASILITSLVLLKTKKKKIAINELAEAFMEHIPGLPMKFAYTDLEEITKNFSEKLGEGGFGNVYEGTLCDGTKVAVKRIDYFENMMKYFFAEVKSIGSIHHANLVRLLGFCAENSHRLLVYEHMPNGSLDKWIFAESEGCALLKWDNRRNIILDVAKGLRYLHEECAQKIVHCDIKPQNILLDENFRAKVSDFGLSKPIDKDQSQAVTTMRGTPGYLAPEWLSGAITEKVDVYSFGMVILDVLCGRKVSDLYLLKILKRNLEEGSLSDMIEDVDKVSATRLVRVSAWCLQADFRKRPSMSTVIKVLEGVSNIQGDEIELLSPGIILDTNASV